MTDFSDRPLGRLKPDSYKHVEAHPAASALTRAPATVERVLKLPSWHPDWDQGWQPSCVGHGLSMAEAIRDKQESHDEKTRVKEPRYDAVVLWNEAKKIDGQPNPDEDRGTYLHAGAQAMVDKGLARIDSKGRTMKQSKSHGLDHASWATHIDEVRAAIAQGLPCAWGIQWHTNFDNPQSDGTWQWAYREGEALQQSRGGHCIAIIGALDSIQALVVKNSWGAQWGDKGVALFPYSHMAFIYTEGAEVMVGVDR